MTGQGQEQLHAPDAAAIEMLARITLTKMPEPFISHLGPVVLVVQDFADEDVLADMGIDNPFELTGLYSGRPVGDPAQTGDLPPTIYLYRRPLLDEWIETGVGLEELVAHVVVHEVGHHFGLSDADMHALEDMVGP